MSGYSLEKLFFGAQKEYLESFVIPNINIARNVDHNCRSKSLLTEANGTLTGRYDGMMERFSSHIFVLDPTIKPTGAKYIGFIGNKLMVEPCDNTIDILTHKRSMRIDSFVLGPRTLGSSFDPLQ